MPVRKRPPRRDSDAGSTRSREVAPTYRNPPLDEVVCGIRFEPLADFKLPHTGVLWERFRSEFPNIEHVVPIIGDDGTVAIDAATGAPWPRLWLSNASGDGLIQFQPDRLYYNWRRRDTEYPRFHRIFPQFENVRFTLEDVLRSLGQPPITTVEHELTYINHIPQGEGWESTRDLNQVVPVFSPTADDFKLLPPPKNFAWNMRFDLPNDQGRLDVRLSQAARRSDKHPLLVLQLAAKGKSVGSTWDASKEWFQTAHHWIVSGFEDITSPTLRASLWGRESV
jgi:uncharacterized protein (TIGR04255 family)